MKYLSLLIGILLFASCKKDEIPFYSGDAGLSFYLNSNESDSLSYSFAFSSVEKQKDTVFLKVRILGAPANYPRKMMLVAADGTTARKGIDYDLPEFVIPAGGITALYPVIVYNTPEMKTKTFRLIVTIAENQDFKSGVIGEETGSVNENYPGTISLSKMKINISNQLTKPSYWSDMEWAFGSFSVTKFKFMIGVTGLTDFSYDAIGDEGASNLPLKLANALDAYELINGPLIDEFGQRVTFY